MIKLKPAVATVLLCLVAALCQGQKKKELKKYGVRSIVVTETTGDKTINDSKTTFNGDGLPVEEVNYDKEGKLKTTTRFKYNGGGDVTEELEYDDKGALKEKRTMRYNVMGEKTEELVQDAGGKQLKRIAYTYDSRGFKTGKQVYDAGDKLVSSKKMSYAGK